MLYDGVVVIAVLILAAALALALGSGSRIAGRDPVYTLYLLAAWFGYLAWCWRRGMTLGMRAWRVVIESDDGGRPGLGQCAIRFGCSLLSAAVAGLGFARAFFDRERRTWHDVASRTRLRYRPAPPRRESQTERRSA